MDYTALITAQAQAQGVPPSLAVAVAQRESGAWWNSAVIPNGGAGEVGIFQILPSTAPGVNLSDPTTNIRTGIAYLSQMLQTFSDPCLAVAAYNCGPGCVAGYLAGARSLPASTIAYVSAVAGCILPSIITASAQDSTASTLPDFAGSPEYMADPTSFASDSIPISAIVFGVLFAGAGLVWFTRE